MEKTLEASRKARIGPAPPIKAFGTRSGGQDERPAPDLVWWPTRMAFDRQLVQVGEPFERKGEVLMLERAQSGALKSRSLGRA